MWIGKRTSSNGEVAPELLAKRAEAMFETKLQILWGRNFKLLSEKSRPENQIKAKYTFRSD